MVYCTVTRYVTSSESIGLKLPKAELAGKKNV